MQVSLHKDKRSATLRDVRHTAEAPRYSGGAAIRHRAKGLVHTTLPHARVRDLRITRGYDFSTARHSVQTKDMHGKEREIETEENDSR